MQTIRQRPFHIVALFLAALMAVGVLTFAGPCAHDDGSVGACFTASRAILAAGVVGAVAALAGLFVKNGSVSRVAAAVVALCGVFAAAAPGTLFGLCMMQTMHCWTAMRPFAMVCGVLLFVMGAVAAVRSPGHRGRAVS